MDLLFVIIVHFKAASRQDKLYYIADLILDIMMRDILFCQLEYFKQTMINIVCGISDIL